MSVFVHRNVGKVYLTAIILGKKRQFKRLVADNMSANRKKYQKYYWSMLQRFLPLPEVFTYLFFFFTNVDWYFTNIFETLLSSVLRWTSQKFKLFWRQSHVISKKEKWHPHDFTTLTLKYLGLESIKKVTISSGSSSAIFTVLNITGRKKGFAQIFSLQICSKSAINEE